MFIALQKKDENIVEYLLYMFQVEDMLRAVKFDMEAIRYNVAVHQSDEPDEQEEVVNWYSDITEEMHDQNKTLQGHIQTVQTIISELHYLHTSLIETVKDENYEKIYQQAYPHIQELKEKAGGTTSEVEIMINAMYGKLILKMSKQEIGEETEKALDTFRIVLAYLAQGYKLLKDGGLNTSLN